MEEKLVRLSDVEYYLRQTAKNMLDDAKKKAELLSDYEQGMVAACVLALSTLADNSYRLPVVDAVPVVHARWQGESDGYADGYPVYDVWYCSECEHCIDDGTDNPDFLPNYCPNCGAKMDGGASDG